MFCHSCKNIVDNINPNILRNSNDTCISMFSSCLIIFTLIDLNFGKVLQGLHHHPFIVILGIVKNLAVLMIHMK